MGPRGRLEASRALFTVRGWGKAVSLMTLTVLLPVNHLSTQDATKFISARITGARDAYFS